MSDQASTLLDRFPALRRLGLKAKRKRIPYIQQLSAAECGAASLAMVLAYHGKQVPLEKVREISQPGRDGSTAVDLIDAAHAFGLRGRGVSLDLDDLEYLDPGSILHWEFRHFVVFERLNATSVDLVDPAMGRRTVPLNQFGRSFTGVALLFEPSDSFMPERGQPWRAWRYLERLILHSGLLARILVTSLLVQVFALGLPALTGAITDRVVPRGDVDLLLILSAGMASLVIFHFLAAILRSHLLLHMRTELDAQMTLGFLDHLVDLPYAFFQRRSAGDLMARLNSNSTVRELLTAGALSGLLDGTLVGLYLLILLFASAPLAGLVLGLALVQVTLFIAARQQQRDLLSRTLEAEARSQGFQVEMLTGIETLKAMGREHRAVERWSGMFVEVLNATLERGRLNALMDSLMSSLRLGSPLLILCFGAWQVLSGELSLGSMLALNALAMGFLGPLSSLVSTVMQLQLLGTYLERLDDVLQTPPEQEAGKVRQAHALKGQIALERVSFRYTPTSPMVIQDVSVEVQPGQLVAIVGPSGAGKSTLASLLLGMYTPTSGRILYDGVDLTELELRSLRRQVGIVMQSPYLFGSSIRANIALSDPEIPLEAVVDAAKLAQLHDEILAMPLGYETPLADRGATLSGGQRQRLALARALVHKPAILLLDEATSALDAVTELKVQQALASLRCTRIVIAHRLSTVVGADLILALDGGRVVEAGTHAELLSRGGSYAALVAAQLG